MRAALFEWAMSKKTGLLDAHRKVALASEVPFKPFGTLPAEACDRRSATADEGRSRIIPTIYARRHRAGGGVRPSQHIFFHLATRERERGLL